MKSRELKAKISELEEHLFSGIEDQVERFDTLLELRCLLWQPGTHRKTAEEADRYIYQKFKIGREQLRGYKILKKQANDDIMSKFMVGEWTVSEALRNMVADQEFKCNVCNEIKKGDRFEYGRKTCMDCHKHGKRVSENENEASKQELPPKKEKKPRIRKDTRNEAAKRMDTPRVFTSYEELEHDIKSFAFIIQQRSSIILEKMGNISPEEKDLAINQIVSALDPVLLLLKREQ